MALPAPPAVLWNLSGDFSTVMQRFFIWASIDRGAEPVSTTNRRDRTVAQRVLNPLQRLREGAEQAHLTEVIDWSRAAVVVREAAGAARDVTAACVTP